jgi:hypothetical protein
MTAYKEGMLVENSHRPGWGPGKIVHISGGRLHVVFRDLEEDMAKLFDSNFPALRPAAQQADPILDNLPPLTEEMGRWVLPAKRYTFESLRKAFLEEFPAGFADPKYLSQEHGRQAARAMFQHELGVDVTRALLNAGHIQEVVKLAWSVVQYSNLISLYEKVALKDALSDDTAARAFFRALLRVLDENPPTERNFVAYLDVLCTLPTEENHLASWPVATLFPYLASPERFMFLKPQTTRNAVASLGFDLKYNPTPNWETYSALQRMGEIYMDLLRPMGARDFVDVQSFIYISCGGCARAKTKATTSAQE